MSSSIYNNQMMHYFVATLSNLLEPIHNYRLSQGSCLEDLFRGIDTPLSPPQVLRHREKLKLVRVFLKTATSSSDRFLIFFYLFLYI